ncbi:hypothetical protein J7E68_09880 [Microbacterium sp. ISL-103]|uniref:hypothetical protein n=1 Tax=Microbacterium sp. ISL-103 TaxID=2819156 RepID=UPI001BEBFD67|nr:hypothetical protein [Microbacterium sp. ISL-103]MBT2474869.1 hypothetical protein [Microbacterium sp. ISL-103]
MRHRILLPDELGRHFTVTQAAAAGIGRGRVGARDLDRPFRGVRSVARAETPLDRVTALAPRLHRGQLVGGETAMRVWGYPHPGIWRLEAPIVVVVAPGSARVRRRGVTGRRLAGGRAHPWRIGGIPVIDPVAALFMCAVPLTDDQAVIALDALISTADNYPGLRPGRPPLALTDIEQRLRAWGRFPGSRRIRDALTRARDGAESPKETETRLLIVAGGLPEPVVQHEIHESGVLIARSDMAYPSLKIAIEYEGDGHRTSREQWRRDIQRQRELEDRGWIVIRVTQLDLGDGGRMLIDHIRRAMASRR